MIAHDGEYFSVAVVEDGAPERRLAARFSTRSEAEAAVERLRQPDGS